MLVVAGLAVLATEFAWAEHLLDKAKKSAAKAGQSAQRIPGVSRVTAPWAAWCPAGSAANRGTGTDAGTDASAAVAVDAAPLRSPEDTPA